MENFIQVFAAEVIAAEATAAIARKHGVAQSSAEAILTAWMDFQATGRAMGYSTERLAEIAAEWIVWEGETPRARPVMENVVALQRG